MTTETATTTTKTMTTTTAKEENGLIFLSGLMTLFLVTLKGFQDFKLYFLIL